MGSEMCIRDRKEEKGKVLETCEKQEIEQKRKEPEVDLKEQLSSLVANK